jgi:DEAD/DEAH box helicase domain-containing protein
VSAIAAFLCEIRAQASLRDALRHHETLAPQAPTAAPLPAAFETLAPLLAHRAIPFLYAHQARALALIEAGADVVLATPTASGKTLVYNLPVLRRALEDPESRALYLFPLKALEQDQRRRLEQDAAALGAGAAQPSVAVYDGDTPQSQRRKIREAPPNILITTPDMLHAGLLPSHAQWARFLRGLRTVVIDELHAYRGIFGSQIAQVLRRLDRVAASYGARPQYIAASATIANPGELANALTGRTFAVVESDGAPRPRRHVLLFQPDGSPYTTAARLFRLAVGLGLRTIAFTKARRVTELMHAWVVEAEPALANRVSSYRSGFLPEERREIERKLFSGELAGVISTSALEMGIDVGGLDVCLLVGYPGSQIATWQRSGRVGRTREAAIALVAQPDALDQYLVTHPSVFFSRGFEHAVVDPHNPDVAAAHLPCAAAELPLRADEPWMATAEARANLARLEDTAKLLCSEDGTEWFSARRYPHRDVDLRGSGKSYSIVLDDGTSSAQPPQARATSPAQPPQGRATSPAQPPQGRATSPAQPPQGREAPAQRGAAERRQIRPERSQIGTIGASRVFAECHEGAIYLHRGRQFLVTRLDVDEQRVHVRAVNAGYYTQTLSEKETEILSRDRARPAGNFRLVTGRLRVTTRLTAFERRRVQGQELLGTEPLDLPPTSFETTGLWLEIPDEIPRAQKEAGRHPMGGLHAVEHAALSLFPLFALCDRHDVGGISTVRHAQVGRAAIFLYDGHAGGVGLATSLFDRAESLLSTTLDLVASCPCEEGCPACVHSPKCGSGNRPIDKASAIHTLRLLLALDPLPARTEAAAAAVAAGAAPALPGLPVADSEPTRPAVLFFDLETQRSAEEVGGWHNAHLMRVSLAVVYDLRAGRFETFRESDVPALVARLAAADLVVGFNVRGFDYHVLKGYTGSDLSELPTFDLLEALHGRLGFRVSLGHLAEETLGSAKSGDGLQALAWWRDGRLAELEEYCRKDVALLRDLFDFALREGYLFMRTRSGDRVRVPTRWSMDELLERARAGPAVPPAAASRSGPRRAPRRAPESAA